MSPDLETEIALRAESSSLPPAVLRAIYLREARQTRLGGTQLRDNALTRIDQFLQYALVRDVRFGRDRDLAPTVVRTR